MFAFFDITFPRQMLDCVSLHCMTGIKIYDFYVTTDMDYRDLTIKPDSQRE